MNAIVTRKAEVAPEPDSEAARRARDKHQVDDILALSPTFREVPRDILDADRSRYQLRKYKRGEVILAEGHENTRIFIISSGRAEVCKAVDPKTPKAGEYRIAELEVGEEFGEVSVVDSLPVSATVRALTAMEILVVDLGKVEGNDRLLRLREGVQLAVGRNLAQRLRSANQRSVQAIEGQLKVERMNLMAGRMALIVMGLFAVFNALLLGLSDSEFLGRMTNVLSPLVTLIFLFGVVFLILRSPADTQSFGLSLNNWKKSTRGALFYTALFCVGLTGLKAALIAFDPMFAGEPLFALGGETVGMSSSGVVDVGSFLLSLLIVAVTAPVQELIVRCGMQAPLYNFIKGTSRRRHFWAILLSNLVYMVTFFHVTLYIGGLIFLTGIFLGWLFARYRSLFAVTVAHIFMAFYGIHVLGLAELPQIIN